MSRREIIVVVKGDGTVDIQVEAPPGVCQEDARRLRAILALLGGRVDEMNVPDASAPPIPIPSGGKVRGGG